jgi:hypothetical protein
MRPFFPIAIMLIVPVSLPAQPPSKPPTEMAKLNFLVGEWHGKGTVHMGPNQKVDVDVVEKATKKVGAGHVIIVEGLGTAKDASGKAYIGHEALGVISFDSATKKYSMRAFRRDGGKVDADITVGDKSFEWGFKDPQRKVEVRFKTVINEKGQWHETGEVSLDGKTWNKFMEMTLSKVN